MSKANKSNTDKKDPSYQRIIGIAMVIGVFIVISQITLYIGEKTSDKTALVSGDTFANASNDSVSAVETGYDFMELLIMAAIGGLILAVLLQYLPIRI